MEDYKCSCGCGGSSNSCRKNSEINYMFFGNLKTIKRMIDELIEMDHTQVDQVLKNGHEWAVDHIASSADDIQEVYNFLTNISDSPNIQKDPFEEKESFIKTFESFINK
jgi:hypothetical protein